MKPIINIRNRPLGHYILSVFSFFLSGENEVLLRSHGSLNGKMADITYLVSQTMLPYSFEVGFENSIAEVEYGHKASALTASLKLQKAKAKEFELGVTPSEHVSIDVTELDLCQLEVLLNLIRKNGVERLQLSSEIEGEEIPIAQIDLAKHRVVISDELLMAKKKEDRRTKVLFDSRGPLVNALTRAAVLKPDIGRLERCRMLLAQWDDVIFGLDTNLFYTATITAFLLDTFLKIPSDDFIDSPDWMTFVVSHVTMGEIENRAGRSKNPVDRRESLRAIQEMMIINRSKDLEGISMFVAGNIPPEIDFTKPETTSIRDNIIREHFRAFLKNLDFYKGCYFVTQDFNNATLAETEGIVALYIKKPNLDRTEYKLLNADKLNASEVIYELSVAFSPLKLKAGELEIQIESDWDGKTLEDWEEWKIKIEWRTDELGLQPKLAYWVSHGVPGQMIEGWRDLRKRYVCWMK